MSTDTQTDVDAIRMELAEHRNPGELLACLGEAWIKCPCGATVNLPITGGVVNQVEALRLFDAHVAEQISDIVRERMAQAWDESAEATADWIANNPGPSGIPHDPPSNPYDSEAQS